MQGNNQLPPTLSAPQPSASHIPVDGKELRKDQPRKHLLNLHAQSLAPDATLLAAESRPPDPRRFSGRRIGGCDSGEAA